MDKLKVVWRYIKKYGFWVTCLVCLLLLLFFWGKSTTALQKAYDTRKGEIEGKFSQMQTIAGTENQPNEQLVQKKNKFLRSQSENIYRTWDGLYEAQRAYCVWPVPNAKYKKAFEGAYVEKLKNPKYEVRDSAREDYWANVSKERLVEVKKLYEIRRPKPEFAELQKDASGNETNVVLRDEQMDGLVWWGDTGYDVLRKRLSWGSRPTTWRILLAQEDLWVYEVILGAVKKTNTGKSAFNASVKEIFDIQVADDATAAFEQIQARVLKVTGATDRPVMSSEDGASGGASGSVPPEEEMMPGAATSGASGAEEEGVDAGDSIPEAEKEYARLIKNRYVDRRGKPLKYAQLKESMVAGYRILPVRIEIMINQRAISQFLVNCANAELPIEILQISTNPNRTPPLALEAKTAEPVAVAENGVLPPTGNVRDRETLEEEETTLSSSESKGYNRGPEDVTLEVLGLVYLFEPPNIKVFESLATQESDSTDDIIEEPAEEEPATEEPVTEEPAVEEPVTEEPAVEEPAVEEPATEEPATEEPATEEPATEEPAAEEPAAEEPATEEPAAEEPAAEEPATEEPVTEEPAAEPATEPVSEPVVEEEEETIE